MLVLKMSLMNVMIEGKLRCGDYSLHRFLFNTSIEKDVV